MTPRERKLKQLELLKLKEKELELKAQATAGTGTLEESIAESPADPEWETYPQEPAFSPAKLMPGVEEPVPTGKDPALPISQYHTAMSKLASGLMLGYDDEFIAAQAAGLGGDHKKSLDALREQKAEMAKQHPWTSGGMSLAGSTITGAALPFAKAGGLWKNMAMGGGLGATESLGRSEADLTEGEYKQAAIDAGIGGVIGAGASGILSAFSRGVPARVMGRDEEIIKKYIADPKRYKATTLEDTEAFTRKAAQQAEQEGYRVADAAKATKVQAKERLEEVSAKTADEVGSSGQLAKESYQRKAELLKHKLKQTEVPEGAELEVSAGLQRHNDKVRDLAIKNNDILESYEHMQVDTSSIIAKLTKGRDKLGRKNVIETKDGPVESLVNDQAVVALNKEIDNLVSQGATVSPVELVKTRKALDAIAFASPAEASLKRGYTPPEVRVLKKAREEINKVLDDALPEDYRLQRAELSRATRDKEVIHDLFKKDEFVPTLAGLKNPNKRESMAVFKKHMPEVYAKMEKYYKVKRLYDNKPELKQHIEATLGKEPGSVNAGKPLSIQEAEKFLEMTENRLLEIGRKETPFKPRAAEKVVKRYAKMKKDNDEIQLRREVDTIEEQAKLQNRELKTKLEDYRIKQQMMEEPGLPTKIIENIGGAVLSGKGATARASGRAVGTGLGSTTAAGVIATKPIDIANFIMGAPASFRNKLMQAFERGGPAGFKTALAEIRSGSKKYED